MNELTKIKTIKTFEKIYLNGNDHSPEEIAKQLTSIIKKARKANITNLRVSIEQDEGDNFTLSSEYITISGLIEETDQEWHNRLQYQKRQEQRKLEEATQIFRNVNKINNDILAIENALNNSPLRCIDCNKPEGMQVCSQDTGHKTIRICQNCINIRETKREQKETKSEEKRRNETR